MGKRVLKWRRAGSESVYDWDGFAPSGVKVASVRCHVQARSPEPTGRTYAGERWRGVVFGVSSHAPSLGLFKAMADHAWNEQPKTDVWLTYELGLVTVHPSPVCIFIRGRKRHLSVTGDEYRQLEICRRCVG